MPCIIKRSESIFRCLFGATAEERAICTHTGVKSLFSHTPHRPKPGKLAIDSPDASCLMMDAREGLRRYSSQDTTVSPCTCPEAAIPFLCCRFEGKGLILSQTLTARLIDEPKWTGDSMIGINDSVRSTYFFCRDQNFQYELPTHSCLHFTVPFNYPCQLHQRGAVANILLGL